MEFVSGNQPVRPAKITEKLGLSRTNVHRLLATLMQIGYVTRDDRGYRLTYKMFQLGSRVPLTQDLREIAKPIMNALMEQANENIYMTVLYEHMVIAMEEVKSRNTLSLNPDVTYTYPVHACASGKVFLGAMDEATQDRLLDASGMDRLSENTVTDTAEYKRQVDQARERGYATEVGEFREDLNSYAAPIYDYRGQVVACISISGPSIRATKEVLDTHVDQLLAAARDISHQLGQVD